MGLQRAHTEYLGQRQRLPVPRLALGHLRRVGLGVNVTKVEERARLVPALPILSGQGERLVRVLPGLINAPLQETNRAELRDIARLVVQRAHAETFPERFFQERMPLGEAARERTRITEGCCDRSSHVPVVGGATEGQA